MKGAYIMQQRISSGQIITIGLAIFSMMFGAGNLMYPIQVGMKSGSLNFFGLAGFLMTAVFLPLVGLVALILFGGDYYAFFDRLGKSAGSLAIAVCMLVIGPILVVPRIITLSHTMIAPFIPITFLQNSHDPFASFIFSLIFLGITFIATFRENKIVDILGKVISPLLLFSLIVIISKGLWSASYAAPNPNPALSVFKTGFMTGYATFDLLAGIFFASIVLHILKNTLSEQITNNPRALAVISTQAGLIGVSLLGLVYIGMSLLGVFHGHEFFGSINAGELFREISFKVLGNQGAALIGTAVLMACLSTSIALGAVIAEYFQETICKNKIGYIPALIAILIACIPLSTFGLSTILELSDGPITFIGYPVVIVLTFCNIAYKLFGFKPVKGPVLATLIIALVSYITSCMW